ncbi:TetR/AcrR family transcriptional regulator [Sodalis sp. dw_96]|uniref:TetR/AcrR family transcriptional regulator n=1 Tax=Sodalis sp. dw_96 TaxID=2719794 RepID=UPI001BD5842C|nr:TetR/AcrR family transcriptional regulator [Sodalis sp. dw_96]
MIPKQTLAVNARKTPQQARSTSTVEAIYEATIQVLLAEGPSRLTTTLVAERAGVSVGSLYQYFPNKQALFYALNQRYLNMLAERVEAACLTHHGKPYAQMVDALVSTYTKVKIERRDVTSALYRAAAEVNVAELVESMSRRVEAASEAMFASAPDAKFQDLTRVNLTLSNVLRGTVRTVFERDQSELFIDGSLQSQLTLMICAYLNAAKVPLTAT